MIRRIEPKGMLIQECCLPGETRADEVFPGHPNGIPLSRDRWLVIYCTRGWRSVDDDRSVVYQIRADRPDGELVKEGFLAQSVDDWDPFGDGRRFVRQHGHPVAFGVPKKAKVEDRAAANANLFVAKWRVKAQGVFDPATGMIDEDREAWHGTQDVEWCQFRLNDAEDDIEILQSAKPLRERGFESGSQICHRPELREMNQSFVQAVPYNASATEWVDVNHFGSIGDASGVVAPLKYRWNGAIGLYEWVETGPVMRPRTLFVFEGSIARTSAGWLIAARSQGAAGWVRTPDPFRVMPEVTFTSDPSVHQPLALYTCADGVPRLLTGDAARSPYGHQRNPLYAFTIDPDTFGVIRADEVFDCVKSNTLPNETIPRGEMAKVLPHAGGDRQFVVWRVRTKNIGHPYSGLPPVTDGWKAAHGLYHAEIVYEREYPPAWEYVD